ASALPCPKRWSASAGTSAWRTAKKVTREPTRSSDVSTSDDSMLMESVSHQAIPLATTRNIATAMEARVASRIRRCGWAAMVASGIERARCPGLARRGPAVFQPVVQAERAVLPELDQQRLHAEARPVGRPRHLADHILGGHRRDALFQRKAAFQRSRLVGRPGADLAAARSRCEVGVGLLRHDLRDRPFEANLAPQRLPVKQQRSLGVRVQLLALAAVAVRIENEAG